MSASAVTATGLTKWFGAKLALDAIDLEVTAGTVLGFLAPHGAGYPAGETGLDWVRFHRFTLLIPST